MWETVDLDSKVQDLPPTPAILMRTSDNSTQFFVTVKKENLTDCVDMAGAVKDLFAIYFDIAYPKQL